MNMIIRDKICRIMILVLLIQWSGLPSFAAAYTLTHPAGADVGRAWLSLPTDAELDAARGVELEAPLPVELDPGKLAEQAKAAEREIPKIDYDVAAFAGSLEAGVEPAFLYVRDGIRYESYPGVLRGAKGAYLSRAGNAFDRSLLLAELLQHKEIKTEFATCNLSRDRAAQLFERIFETKAVPAQGDGPRALPATAEAFLDRLKNRARRDYAAIMTALDGDLPFTVSPSRDEVIEEIRNHVWVRAQQHGTWVDLDTAFAAAESGETFCGDQVVEGLKSIPDDAHQTVTIRVKVETLSEGAINTETVLDVTRKTADLTDRHVFLLHGVGTGRGGLAGDIGSGILGADTWTPLLMADGEPVAGKPVTYADQKGAERGKPPSGGFTSIFKSGGALGGGERYFVAEWLEFEIGFPDGREAEITRRALADRAGMAWRRAGTLDPDTLRPLSRDDDGLISPREVHNVWFTAGPHDLASYAASLRSLAERGRGGFVAGDIALQVWPVAMANFALVFQSDHFVVPALNDSPGLRFYADSPRILMFSVGAGPEGGAFFQYDLRRDDLRGVARNGSAERELIARKIWFGALEGALEHEAAAYNAVSLGDPASAVDSTSALLNPEGAIVLTADAHAGDPLADDPETAARMAGALANGATLVVPKAALAGGSYGWWEIARDGGRTRAVFDRGLHLSTEKVSREAIERGVQSSQSPQSAASRKPGERRGSEYFAMIVLGGTLTLVIERRYAPVLELVVAALGKVIWETVKGSDAPPQRDPTDRDPGDCTKARQEALQHDVNLLCKNWGARRCEEGQKKAKLNVNLLVNRACLQARQAIGRLCYPGDLTHNKAITDAEGAVRNCMDMLPSPAAADDD